MTRKRREDDDRAVSNHPESNEPSAPGAEDLQSAIAARAHDLYVARGADDGHDVEDWLQAEREIRARRR